MKTAENNSGYMKWADMITTIPKGTHVIIWHSHWTFYAPHIQDCYFENEIFVMPNFFAKFTKAHIVTILKFICMYFL